MNLTNADFVSTHGPLPDLLDPNGTLRLWPAAHYDTIPRVDLRVWCHQHARYGLPTAELVAWLEEQIAGRVAIEIGSGCGDLAYHLRIPATDSRIQEEPAISAYYEAIGQPICRYPSWVDRYEAHLAVAHYRPDVVVASWVTQWIDPSIPSATEGSMFGVHEELILSIAKQYILLGNLAVHGQKKIMRRPHRELALPFLRSRAKYPELDRVFVWPA
jgi:hypothetical protein